jgi:hypothetical protein
MKIFLAGLPDTGCTARPRALTKMGARVQRGRVGVDIF